MSLCLFGQDHKVVARSVIIKVPATHPLIQLAQVLPWSEIINLALPDLKKTAKGFWWLGRKLSVRLHIAVYLLQILFDLTDRKMEEGLRYNGAYRLFTGFGFLKCWRAIDHTKIEEFRNRLSAETKRDLANLFAKHAVTLGFADPSQVDIDSTVQEANASYPSDASLMVKLSQKCKEVVEWLKLKKLLPKPIEIDMKAIRSTAKGYFFLAKNTATNIRQEAFASFHKLVKEETYPLIQWLEQYGHELIIQAKWNVAEKIKQISEYGRRYLLDVAHFVRTHSIKSGKRLSFHCDNIACIVKNKAGKKYEFGRVFQIGRIGGNFAFVDRCIDLVMNDKKSLIPTVKEHKKIFGKKIDSLTTDKGYYSHKNTKYLQKQGIKDFHLGYQYEDQSEAVHLQLYNRRAGVEPIIGHIKKGGQLGRSRMKSDEATLGAGYASVASFNMRQLLRAI